MAAGDSVHILLDESDMIDVNLNVDDQEIMRDGHVIHPSTPGISHADISNETIAPLDDAIDREGVHPASNTRDSVWNRLQPASPLQDLHGEMWLLVTETLVMDNIWIFNILYMKGVE